MVLTKNRQVTVLKLGTVDDRQILKLTVLGTVGKSLCSMHSKEMQRQVVNSPLPKNICSPECFFSCIKPRTSCDPI